MLPEGTRVAFIRDGELQALGVIVSEGSFFGRYRVLEADGTTCTWADMCTYPFTLELYIPGLSF
jgi:hypothetical protein